MSAAGALRALAPAKVNLGLFVGQMRASDRRHELVTVMQSISLADELTLAAAGADAAGDEVLCAGVPGPARENLAARALAAFRRETSWDGPPQFLEIVKRIPVAAGLGGGSADAAAALRLAQRVSGLGRPEQLRAIAAELGADVPSQLEPGRWLARGAGEALHELPAPSGPLGVLVLPLAEPLATGQVYAEADRLGCVRGADELETRAAEIATALQGGAPLPASELLHNDLERAAVSLCPPVADALAEAREAGADAALVSGSGPTVLGLFATTSPDGEDPLSRARAAAIALGGRTGGAIIATAVGADDARPRSAAGT